MLSDRLLTELRKLSGAEKLRVVQILVNELAAASNTTIESLMKPGAEYEIWSPYDSYEAAQQLQDILDEYKRDHEHI
jgi:hypothetical protein